MPYQEGHFCCLWTVTAIGRGAFCSVYLHIRMVFGPLKRHWSTVCHGYLQSHPTISSYLQRCGYLHSHPLIIIVPGFRKCGVMQSQFLVLRRLQFASSNGLVQAVRSDVYPIFSPSTQSPPIFTEEEVKIFNRRYVEGYDVFNDQYFEWLELNHLGVIPHEDG